MASKFNIVIIVFKICSRKISILNTKYYESPCEKMILLSLSCLQTILMSRTMNSIISEAYLGNSYYEYELAENLATCSKNQNIYFRFFV